MKYTMEGYVKVSLHYTHEEAIVEVADTGVGIPSECQCAPPLTTAASDLSSVGERFFRAESVAHLHEGTGIGLSLTKVGSLRE